MTSRKNSNNTKDEAIAYLERFSCMHVLIVGDLMLDRYIRGEVRRISPEAPVPVVNVMEKTVMPGGAGNVGVNIASLGGTALLHGILGNDGAGSDLLAVLKSEGVNISGVIESDERRTIEKTRVYAHDHQEIGRAHV